MLKTKTTKLFFLRSIPCSLIVLYTGLEKSSVKAIASNLTWETTHAVLISENKESTPNKNKDRRVENLPFQDRERANLRFSLPILADNRLSWSEKALVYNKQASKLWQKGRIQDAIGIWELEKIIYQEQNLERREIETILKISKGYTILGQFELANFHLEQALALAERINILEGQILEQLGNVANRSGDLSEAISYYQKSLSHTQSRSTLNNLAISLAKRSFRWQLLASNSIEREKAQYEAQITLDNLKRQKYLKQALSVAEAKAGSSMVVTLIEYSKHEPLSQKQLIRGRKILSELPPSRTKVFLVIDWAKIERDSVYWLEKALDVANNLGEREILSYPFLELGLLFERKGDREKAVEYGRKATVYASESANNKILYRSLWLIARMERKAGQNTAAIKSYREAINSLADFYQQTHSISAEQRLDFATSTEPLYRQALQLILEVEKPSQSQLQQALEVFNRLQLAQLQQFFGDDCFLIERRKENQTDILSNNNAVLLTSIILEDQSHFILQLPNGQLIHHQSSIDRDSLSELLTQWHQELENPINWQFQVKGKRIYDLILRPFEKQINPLDPDSIIFVHDGIFRNIPMAALHDGEQFVAQKWASITSTGLVSNYNEELNSVENQEDRIIAFGLGTEVQGWWPLSGVVEEIQIAIAIIGGKEILNNRFTARAFFQKLDAKHNIIHMASHAYFGGTAENSFVLAYDRPLYTRDLERAILPSHDLLVFSACETALSSDRSALGLAGLGLRNGVDSIGSLWQIQDEEQISLIEGFYSTLEKTNLTKALALQQVQTELIRQEAHPSKWAALVLMQNF